MPKVRSYVPSWLNEPAPGQKLFASSSEDARPPAQLYSSKPKPGPRRTIAHRGTEIFVAVGKQIRWGSLVRLKESWESKQSKSAFESSLRRKADSHTSFEVYDEGGEDGSNQSDTASEGYRVIKTPAADEIRQLIMSPNEDYLAVLTSHTVHICILPDSSHLTAGDSTPFRPKFWTLGPTTHVTSRTSVSTAIWHPLGVNGSALVTVTEDAIVRVWELSASDRWSFDRPTLAIDLKRLADGTSSDQDFSASTSATNHGFSPDSFEMEVTSACFGDRRSGGWSPMTLWVVMKNEDVYALCPLLPSKWAPPPTLIPALSVSIVPKMAATEEDASISAEARLLTQQQLDWMADLDGQEPKLVDGPPGEPVTEVYTRPAKPGAIPKLQGPFYLDLAPVQDGEDESTQVTDIYVVGEKMSTGDLMIGEDVDLELDDSDDGLSLSVICLLTRSGQVQIYLDTDGVEAQWLPTRKMKLAQANGNGLESEFPTLLNFQTLETQTPSEIKNVKDNWPVFSGDATSRYAFFVTQSTGITFVSLSSWVFRLESELQSESEAGSKFRIDLLAKGNGSTREKVFVQKRDFYPLAACASLRDPDLGYFVLSAAANNAVTVFFDVPEDEFAVRSRPLSSSGMYEERDDEDRQALTIWEPRPYFHAAGALNEGSRLPHFVDHLKAGPRRPLMQQEVRMSPVTLEIFTDTHKLVSAELDPLNTAVAELFRKCEALQAELREQIGKTNEVRQRVEAISGEDVGGEEPVSEAVRIQTRLERAQSRQGELAQRMERVKSKLGKVSSRELSDYERAWMSEVKALESTILGTGEMAAQSTSRTKPPLQRLEEIKRLKEELAAQVSQFQPASIDGQHDKNRGEERSGSPGPNNGVKVPVDIRKAKYAQVRMMLERESALVEGVKTRLEQLNVG